MEDKQKQIEEMPICVNCFHAYVCEEYNLNRDTLRKKCAYHNDHFFDINQYEIKVRKETAERFAEMLKERYFEQWENLYYRNIDEICKEITEGSNGTDN